MKHIIVPAYHSFKDPIIYGLLYKYLVKFQDRYSDQVVFHLITFEQKDYAVTLSERKKITEEHTSLQLLWHPISYHTGGKLILLKKVWDFMLAFFMALKLRVKHQATYLIGFTSISCVMAWQLSQLLRMKAICLNMEPHSEYMLDFGIWKPTSLAYKLLRKLEHKTMVSAYKMALPTRNACHDFQYLRKEQMAFVPTSIDLDDFGFKPAERAAIRKKHQIREDDFLILYLGKFDGIYFSMQETAVFLKKLSLSHTRIRFMTITPNDLSVLNRTLAENELTQVIALGKIPYEKLSGYISCADAGLLMLPEYPSQRYRCPIKTANYLACGTPIIVNKIVGDDPFLIQEKQVGWVVDLENPTIDIEKPPQRAHCMNVVSEERSIQLVTDFLYQTIY